MASKSKFAVKRNQEEMDAMLPFMSLLLIIIPVLIGNISFFHLKTLSFSTPGVSEPQDENTPPPPPATERKVMSQLLIEPEFIMLELVDEETAEVIKKEKLPATDENAKLLWEKLAEFKNEYTKLDMLMVNVYEETPYDLVARVIESVKEPVPASKLPSMTDLKSVDVWKVNMVMLPATKEKEGDLTSEQ
jgi:hypothetical protein